MKLYASLHTALPTNQCEHEVAYPGYERMEVDYEAHIGRKESVRVFFPVIPEDQEDVKITHISFGPEKTDNGGVVRTIATIPHVPVLAGIMPKVVLANIPEPLPDNLNPVARELWKLINDGDVPGEWLPPGLFEALNNELDRCGVPVIKITREGTAKMVVEISKMKSLNLSA